LTKDIFNPKKGGHAMEHIDVVIWVAAGMLAEAFLGLAHKMLVKVGLKK